MHDTNIKSKIDWLVSIVIMLAYLRLFILFLVIPSVSRMLLTLAAMLKDVTEFFALMLCYLFFSMQVFQTLYQDKNSNYSNMWLSVRATYDIVCGSYSYSGAGE